ncbi:hypothetical protein [uncultured Salinicola sp.]|uniref:hypothetical protein n=1 Tax=uncultured Salinicola sp. TaxID=1193542 RepID=UPI00260906D6|nr:hypothetical protein [uncultured Salinicola sp.]|tara:strand:+ start:2534 stop:3007 length:474 start_codon:yes stop_codon:yes gene_type:complete
MKRSDPLLDDGMVALLRWLEQTRPRILRDIHQKCLDTTGDNAKVYERKRSADDWIEISHRDDPEDPSGRMILIATIYGKSWTLTNDLLVIGRKALTQTSLTVLCDPDGIVDASTIIDHPYLTGAKAGDGEMNTNLLLSIYREPARHVLTSTGIEAMT